MKKTFLLLLMVVLAISCVLTSCNKEKTPESIEVKTDSIKTEYTVGETPDFSGIKVTLKYTDGTTEELSGDKLTIGTIDTATEGTKKLTVTYDKLTVNVDITVKAAGGTGDGEGDGNEEEETGNLIMGAALPSNLTALAGKKDPFRDKTQVYVVGDDNPYIFKITVVMLDENFEMVDNAPYVGLSKIYLVGETTTLLEGADVAKYVAIDEVNHTYDFTEDAIGKTFKIEVRPNAALGVSADKATCTQTVKVVDAYNIYDNKELNFITNDPFGTFGENDEGQQLLLVNNFLAANGLVRPAKLAGVVLHNDVVLTTADIPAEYVIPETAGDNVKGFLYDWLMIYRHALTKDQPTFDIHGNYYTIDSGNLPWVAPAVKGYNNDGISNSMLFMFTVDQHLTYTRNSSGGHRYEDSAAMGINPDDYLTYNPTDYKTNVYNLAMRDNEPNSNKGDLDFLEMSKRGLIGFKTRFHEVNITNTRVEAYMISLLTDYDQQVVNLDKVDFYNAWQNHIFSNSKNYLWEQNYVSNSAPAANHLRATINVKDSRLAKCGGPVIMSMQDDVDYAANVKSGNLFNIDAASELYSYVNGTEPWFQAYGVTDTVTQIIGLSRTIENTVPAGVNASYITDVNGNPAINFIMINMPLSMGLTMGGPDVDGVLNIDGDKILNMDDGANTWLDTYLGATQGQAPIFQSSADGTCYSDGASGVYGIESGNIGTPTANCFEGDYLTLYYMGLGMVFEYYHNAPAAN